MATFTPTTMAPSTITIPRPAVGTGMAAAVGKTRPTSPAPRPGRTGAGIVRVGVMRATALTALTGKAGANFSATAAGIAGPTAGAAAGAGFTAAASRPGTASLADEGAVLDV